MRRANDRGADGSLKLLLASSRLLALDFLSTLFFLFVVLLTNNVALAVALAMTLGVAQMAWRLTRAQPVGALPWLSLMAVLISGAATLFSDDPRFVMIKPSFVYAIAGVAMMSPGWMTRFLPPVGQALVTDLAVTFGFAWAALMFFTAALNLYVAMNYGVVTWSAFMSIFALFSKLAMFAVGFAILGLVGGRRWRAEMAGTRA